VFEYIFYPGNLVLKSVKASGPWRIQRLEAGYVPPLGIDVPVPPASTSGGMICLTTSASSSMAWPSTATRKL
jgi:hypothetical protein